MCASCSHGAFMMASFGDAPDSSSAQPRRSGTQRPCDGRPHQIGLGCQYTERCHCSVLLLPKQPVLEYVAPKRRMGSLATLLEGDFGFESYVDLALKMPMMIVRRCAQ